MVKVENGIVLHGVLFRGNGAIVFFCTINVEDEVLVPFGAVLDCRYFARVDDISIASIPPVLRNRHGESH